MFAAFAEQWTESHEKRCGTSMSCSSSRERERERERERGGEGERERGHLVKYRLGDK